VPIYGVHNKSAALRGAKKVFEGFCTSLDHIKNERSFLAPIRSG
jgi:hypothetical protein